MQMYGYWAIAAVFLAVSVWHLLIAVLGLFPQCRSTAVGTLADTSVRRNYIVRGRRIPIRAKYTYVYTVRGKQYRYTSLAFHSERRLLRKVTMVYVKGFPRHAYPNRFSGILEWSLGLMTLFTGLLLCGLIAT